jgi:hypothetical protein
MHPQIVTQVRPRFSVVLDEREANYISCHRTGPSSGRPGTGNRLFQMTLVSHISKVEVILSRNHRSLLHYRPCIAIIGATLKKLLSKYAQ